MLDVGRIPNYILRMYANFSGYVIYCNGPQRPQRPPTAPTASNGPNGPRNGPNGDIPVRCKTWYTVERCVINKQYRYTCNTQPRNRLQKYINLKVKTYQNVKYSRLS